MVQNDNINAARIDSGFVMPPDRLSGMGKELSFEAIYERLPDDVGDSHHWGVVRDHPGRDGEDATLAELKKTGQDVRIMVNLAATQAKAKGRLPGDLEHLVTGITHPLLNWREVLRRFMT